MTDQYLAHHGVLGMKWGVRRFQNKDGSLTAAGKKRERQGDGSKKKMSTKKKLAIAGGVAAGAALAGAGAYAAYKLKPVAVTTPTIIGRGARGKALWGNVTKTIPRYQLEKSTKTIPKTQSDLGKQKAMALVKQLQMQNKATAAVDTLRYEAAIKKKIAEHNPKQLGAEGMKRNIVSIASMDARQKQLKQRAGEDFTAELLRKNAKNLERFGVAPKNFSQMTMDDLKKLDLY